MDYYKNGDFSNFIKGKVLNPKHNLNEQILEIFNLNFFARINLRARWHLCTNLRAN